MSKFVRLLILVAIFAMGIWAEAAGLVGSVIDLWGDIVFLTQEHIMLVLISGGLAIATGIPLGILLSRPQLRGASEGIMQGLNVGTTIPTLAILALAMTFLGIGTPPAIFGLWLASLLPIVRNTYQGILGIPAHMIEAAKGQGMTAAQILIRVEIPNALFVIFAGVRTALAINVGTAPLAFLIGGGGLGELIFTGIDLYNFPYMLSGAIPVAMLAVLVDYLMLQCQYWLVPKGVNPLR
jgi:osmoprotectant transport system permease protein